MYWQNNFGSQSSKKKIIKHVPYSMKIERFREHIICNHTFRRVKNQRAVTFVLNAVHTSAIRSISAPTIMTDSMLRFKEFTFATKSPSSWKQVQSVFVFQPSILSEIVLVLYLQQDHFLFLQNLHLDLDLPISCSKFKNNGYLID